MGVGRIFQGELWLKVVFPLEIKKTPFFDENFKIQWDPWSPCHPLPRTWIGTQCFPFLGAQRCNTALIFSQQNLRTSTPQDKQPFSHLLKDAPPDEW